MIVIIKQIFNNYYMQQSLPEIESGRKIGATLTDVHVCVYTKRTDNVMRFRMCDFVTMSHR